MKSDKPAGPILSDPASVSIPIIPKNRGWIERAKRYFTGADLDEAEAARVRTITRVQDDLPPQVRGVAVGQLITNGLSALSGFGLSVGAVLFAVISPFWYGRTGVGYSMIALFGGCLLAVVSTIPFFVARGAARILRRDPRGVKPVLRWAWVFALGSTIALLGLAGSWVHELAINGVMNRFSMLRGIISVLSSVAFQSWTIFTLRKYQKEVAAEIAASEAETVSESRRPRNSLVPRAQIDRDRTAQ